MTTPSQPPYSEPLPPHSVFTSVVPEQPPAINTDAELALELLKHFEDDNHGVPFHPEFIKDFTNQITSHLAAERAQAESALLKLAFDAGKQIDQLKSDVEKVLKECEQHLNCTTCSCSYQLGFVSTCDRCQAFTAIAEFRKAHETK